MNVYVYLIPLDITISLEKNTIMGSMGSKLYTLSFQIRVITISLEKNTTIGSKLYTLYF